MARQLGSAVENNFVQGLITDSTGLNFPENAVTDEDNCVFDENGSVTPRLGFDFETDYETKTIDRSGVVVESYLWRAAAGNGENNFIVLQVGSELYFYRVGSGAISSDFVQSIDLTSFSPTGAPNPETTECQFADGNGYLFVSHPNLETFYVSYDPSADSFSGTQINIKIRDFEGVDDGLDIDEQPSSLSNTHKYNLYNQGWQDDTGGDNYINSWENTHGVYPANTHQWWVYRDANSDFKPNWRDRFDLGNTPAPKGHFILDLYRQDRSAVSGISGLSVTSAGSNRASTVAFFAGRVWYSGVKGQDYSTEIYFSQIIQKPDNFGKCYQANDPTSEENFDLLPSDGGVIRIPDAGNIIKLVPVRNNLIVFASNGIWSITGSEGIGFTANDFSVSPISGVAPVSASSFVQIAGLPAWWSQEGIYSLQVSQQLGNVEIQRITDQKIEEYFETIPADAKAKAKGAYNPITKVCQWVYRDISPSNTTEAYEFNKVLNLNVQTGAFYRWSPDTTNVAINSLIVVEGSGVNLTQENVTDNNGDVITDNSGSNVTVTVENEIELSAVFRYVVSYPQSGSYEFTFADTSNAGYIDWEEYDSTGVAYKSYFVSGYKLHGEGQRKFQSNYVFLFTEPDPQASQLFFQGRWGYATSGDTGRWGSKQKIVFDGGSYDYNVKKIKVRGHGKVLQYYVENVPGQPFNIIGWSVFESVNQIP